MSALDEQKMLKELANGRRIALYKRSGDKALFWAATCKKERLCVTYGMVEGKLQNSETISQGKNIGRSNETSPEVQCTKMALSQIKKKIDQLYELKEDFVKVTEQVPAKKQKTGETPGISAEYFKTFRPTLAFGIETLKKPVSYDGGQFVQIKYDGIRNLSALVDGQVVFQSRNGKINNNLGYLEPSVRRILEDHPGLILDGELYSPEATFEQICGSSKKENDVKLCYFIYDCMDTTHPEATFQQRFLNRFNGITEIGMVKVAPTFIVNSEEEMMSKHAEFVADGEEGLILRNPNSSYELKRSKNLLKVKQMVQDSESWKIVGYESAQGRDTGSVVFIMESDDGQVKFSSRPAMTLQKRQEIFQECERDFKGTYYGKRPTIQYQNLTGGNCPRFPIIKCIDRSEIE